MAVYVQRGVEADIVAYVADVLADPLRRFHVALLTGSPGLGAAELLVHGVVPRLSRAGIAHEALRITGEWFTDSGERGNAAVQFCLAESEVPGAPPTADCPVRLLLVVCSDVDALPEWVSQGPPHEVRTLPIGSLSLFEAHDFIEAALGGTVDAVTAHHFASLSGFAPGPLQVLLDESRKNGALQLFDGFWSLTGDPVELAIVPYLKAQLSSVSTDYANTMFHLALSEPFAPGNLPAHMVDAVEYLLRVGELHRRDDGLIEFFAPVGAQALRMLAPAEIRQRQSELENQTASNDIAMPGDRAATTNLIYQGGAEAADNSLRNLAQRISAELERVSQGAPATALRNLISLRSDESLGVPAHNPLDAQLRQATVWAALATTGPATYPQLARQLGQLPQRQQHPDLTQLYTLRAQWEYASGNIKSAGRLATFAVEVAAHTAQVDEATSTTPITQVTQALLAETSALRGDHAQALKLLEQVDTAACPSRVLTAAIERHCATAAQLLAVPQAGEQLRRVAADFVASGDFGSASEVLHAGLRFGRRRAAKDLLELADHLEGSLHELRLSHARAVLGDDPIAMFSVAESYRAHGWLLVAAECDAIALRMPDVPDSIRNRATHALSAYLSTQRLDGHEHLREPRLGTTVIAELTPREREVTGLIHAGLSNAEIAKRLHVSVGTIEGHITRIYRKTGGTRRAPARKQV